MTLLLLNGLALVAFAAVAIGLVWAIFRLLGGFPIRSEDRKWAIPAAGGGFVLLFTTLITIFLPIEGGEGRNVLVQNTIYGPLEIDIDRLFLEPDDGVPRITSDFFLAPDSSFFLRLPPGPSWLVQVDSTPALEAAIEIQTPTFVRNVADLIPLIVGLPQLNDPTVDRFCMAENRVQRLLVRPSSTIDGVRVDFNPLARREYWRHIIHRFRDVAELLPLFTEEELAEMRRTPDWELDSFADSMAMAMRQLGTGPPKREIDFRNSLCIASIGRQDLRSALRRVVGLPARSMTLMGAAQTLADIIPSFSVGALETPEVSRDSRALLGRDPILLEGIGVPEHAESRIAIEQLQLVALGEESVFFVQLQFLVAPGEDLLAWREIQDALRSLRFLESADSRPASAEP